MPVALEPLCIQIPQFDLARTLDCGQAFRWSQLENGAFHGVAFGRPLTIRQEGERIFFSCSQEEFDQIWFSYFDLGRDYGALCERFRADTVMRQALDTCPGIRILQQEPWEALCSFIISQNNHIPRIKGIIGRLCEAFGEPLGSEDFTFPSPERLAALDVSALAPLRAGFRAGYLLDAAQKLPRERLASKHFPPCRWSRPGPPCKKFGAWGRRLRNAPCSMDVDGWTRFPSTFG